MKEGEIPVIPIRLFKSSTQTRSNLLVATRTKGQEGCQASFCVNPSSRCTCSDRSNAVF